MSWSIFLDLKEESEFVVLWIPEAIPTAEIPDTIPVASSTDWQAAFGFTSASVPAAPPAVAPPSVDSHIDDDLGMTNQQNVNECNVGVKISGNSVG